MVSAIQQSTSIIDDNVYNRSPDVNNMSQNSELQEAKADVQVLQPMTPAGVNFSVESYGQDNFTMPLPTSDYEVTNALSLR